jgi:desulfoferrodoxin-like iron-binding protein
MATQTGKRYACATCGTEMLVTRGGTGELSCCGQPMQLREAPPRSPGQSAPSEVQRG